MHSKSLYLYLKDQVENFFSLKINQLSIQSRILKLHSRKIFNRYSFIKDKKGFINRLDKYVKGKTPFWILRETIRNKFERSSLLGSS